MKKIRSKLLTVEHLLMRRMYFLNMVINIYEEIGRTGVVLESAKDRMREVLRLDSIDITKLEERGENLNRHLMRVSLLAVNGIVEQRHTVGKADLHRYMIQKENAFHFGILPYFSRLSGGSGKAVMYW